MVGRVLIFLDPRSPTRTPSLCLARLFARIACLAAASTSARLVLVAVSSSMSVSISPTLLRPIVE